MSPISPFAPRIFKTLKIFPDIYKNITIFHLILQENISLLKSYRLIVFISSILLVFFSAISQTSQKQNINPFEFNLTYCELTIPWCTPGTKMNLSNNGIKVSYISKTKSELWKGIVKSHTYFTR